MFAYCRNNPANCFDAFGTRDASIWSLKNDEVGREILYWYLYGNGEDFPANDKHSAYLKNNDLLKTQVRNYVFLIAKFMPEGSTKDINVSLSMEIENGEDIIGYQYLHGTNALAGGFQIQGNITKMANGYCIFDLTYTWNDIIDPNPQYSSDIAKAKLAKMIPFANPTDYAIAISWHDVSIGPTSGAGLGYLFSGWLYS